jgi:hypothetical protein
MSIYASHARTGARRGAPASGVPIYAKVQARGVNVMYEGVGTYMATPDGGITRPYLDKASKLKYIIVSHNETWDHAALRTAIDYMHDKNPDLEVFLYRNVADRYPDATYASSPYTYEGLKANQKLDVLYGGHNWWCHQAAAPGVKVDTYPGQQGTNYSLLTTPDAQGRRYPQWYAEYMSGLDDAEGLTSRIAGWFLDNTKSYPSNKDIDWNNSGTDISPQSVTGLGITSAGHAAFINRIKQLKPSYKIIGNSEFSDPIGTTIPTFYGGAMNGLMDGGMYEIAMDYSLYNQLQYHALSRIYGQVYVPLTSYLNSNKLQILHGGMSSASDWQRPRYTIGASLLGDGISWIARGIGPDKIYLDEHDARLGAPLDPAPAVATTGEFWTRRYQNGLVVVSAYGNLGPPRTADMTLRTYYPTAGIYKHIAGTQDAVNVPYDTVVGAGGVTMPGWDARILLCVTPGVHS